MNDLFIDNDNNNSSNDNFVLTVLFIHFAFSVAVFDVTVHQNKEQFKNFKREC